MSYLIAEEIKDLAGDSILRIEESDSQDSIKTRRQYDLIQDLYLVLEEIVELADVISSDLQ